MSYLTEALSNFLKKQQDDNNEEVKSNIIDKKLEKILKESVSNVNVRNCKSFMEKAQQYERALIECIEGQYPDKHWSDITNCNIYNTLIECDNDTDEVIKRILNESNAPQHKEFKTRKTLNESLTEGKWNYTLKNGSILRQAIDDEDLLGTCVALQACYDELAEQGLIDEYDRDQYNEEIDYIDLDDYDAEEEVNYALDDFFDLCDSLKVWVPLAEKLEEGREEDLDKGIKDEQETIDLYAGMRKKDYFDNIEKDQIKEIEDDEEDHKRILKKIKARKLKRVEESKSAEEVDKEADSIEKRNDEDAEELTEDTVKQGSHWVNKGKEGTHGKFKTKKAADAQRKAMFANVNGYKEELTESDSDEEAYQSLKNGATLKDALKLK